jgi:hypothetical protein
MLIEVELCREMAKLVRRNHHAGLPRNKLGDLVPKAARRTASAVFAREKPGRRRFNKDLPVVLDVDIKLACQPRRNLCLDSHGVFCFVRRNTEECATADKLQMPIKAQTSEIAGAQRNVEQNASGDGQLDLHGVAPVGFATSAHPRQHPFRQHQQAHKLLEFCELSEAAAIFLREACALRLQRLTLLA